MNVPPPPAGPSTGAPNIPDDSISESGSDMPWSYTSETSNEESDEGEVDTLADEGCADEAYWEDDNAVDSWLARYPGGDSALYPQLFIVKPRDGKVLTPPRYPNKDSLLRLPSEIRERIYGHYFDRDVVSEVNKHPEEDYPPFYDREGRAVRRICLGTDFMELKFWLSTALLQTSRQLRYEAMCILFSDRVLTVEWLPVLPRLVRFLGTEGCAMVRYLDLWDSLCLQADNKLAYSGIITNVVRFSSLQHLRIVVSWGLRHSGVSSSRIQSWFDEDEWTRYGMLKENAVPKMRSTNIERNWPEYEVLKSLRAQKFTLALITYWGDKYVEFDRCHGAYPKISQYMQSIPPSSSASGATSSLSTQDLDAFEFPNAQPRSSTITPNTEFDEETDCPTWQETDALENKTIPLYNFLREFFHNNPAAPGLLQDMSAENFIAFPTAQKSTGSVMQDCGFCYLSQQHCGYHAVPDQPPFERTPPEDDAMEEDVESLQKRFENLSYVDMRKVCRDVVQWMENADTLANTSVPWDANATEFLKITAMFDYFGWPEPHNTERLARLDAAAEAGWTGKRVDKDEVPPWDMLYREVHACYSKQYRFVGESRRQEE